MNESRCDFLFLLANQRSKNMLKLTPSVLLGFMQAVASRDTPIFTKLRSVWAFAPCSSPSQNHPHDASPARAESKTSKTNKTSFTRFSLDLEFGFINPLHAALSAASMGRVSEKMAEAFVARCTQMYGSNDGLTR
jgi:ribosome-associated toxin RatA of RatAB toxin-antitoxin module